jgi:hypothetical protein
MMKTESLRTVPTLTRFAWAVATLAGVGAALGLGLGALHTGEVLPEFVATNAMKLSARMVLIKWLFGLIFAVPGVVAFIAVLRVSDPNRLVTYERWASRLAPLSALGLWPLLLHGTLWKGKTLLFLVATLTATLLVYGSLRNVQPWQLGSELRLVFQSIRRRTSERFAGFVPWLILGISIFFVLRHQLTNEDFAVAREYHGRQIATYQAALRQMGHGGFLGVPFILIAKFRQPGTFNSVIVLFAISAASLPLYAWAKNRLATLPSLLVALAYLSFPSLLTAGVKEPLPLGVAAAFFFLAVYAWEKHRYLLATLAALFMLFVHEQTAFWLLGVGVCLAQKQRPLKWFSIVGFLLLAYFFWIALSYLPGIGLETYGKNFHSLWAGKERGIIPAILTVFVNPVHALMKLADQKDLLVWLLLVVPFALLPLFDKRWVLWVMPFTWFGIVMTGHFPTPTLTQSSVTHFVVMGFVAVISVLESVRREKDGKARQWAALLTWAFALVPCIYQFGCAWLSPL